jgi:hypothetical protein
LGQFLTKTYKLLPMPETDDPEALTVGEFCPGDSAPLVLELSRLRCQQLANTARLPFLHPDISRVVAEMRFHTYEDFLLTLKHGAPKKGDYITAGHSLNGFEPRLAGYLAYLQKNAPDLHGFFFRRLQARIPEDDRRRHTYVLGKSGSGKSELLKVLVHGYLRKPGFCTVVIIDPHGDFAEEVAKFRENRDSDRLIFIDPYLSPGYTPTVNPLYLRDHSPQNVDITAQALVDAFKQILDNTSLTVQMEALLVPCLTVLLLRENSTLIDLQRFLNDEKNDDLVSLGKQSQHPAHRLFFRDRFYERTFAATKASISTKLQSLLNSQTFYHLTVGRNTVDLEAVLNGKKLVVFNLAKGKLGSDTSEAFGRFLLALMQSAILKRAQSAKGQRVPVHLFIDEFQTYISPSIAEILAESRKYGLHLTMAQQYLGQQMDTDFRRGILANTQVKMTGMSANDSRAAIAKETGIGESDLAGLGKGQFYVKVGNRPAFKLYVPSLLIGTKHAMAAKDWQTVKTRQLENYYRRLSQPQPAAPDNRGGDPKEYEAPKPQAEAAEETAAPKPANARPVKPKFTFEE